MTDTTNPESVQQEPTSNIRETIVPIPTPLLREFFGNKELLFILNYSKSQMRGAQFLTYTTNLDLPCDIFFECDENNPIPFEEYSEILLAYLQQNSLTRMAGLHILAAQMLLLAKGVDYDVIPYELPISEEYIKRFIDENKELVERCLHFIDSAHVFAIHAIPRLKQHYKPEENFEVIEDRTYVGANLAMLFGMPEFTAYYFNRFSVYRLSYFKPQFEEYMFKGAHLSKYFDNKNNLAAVLFAHYAAGEFRAAEIQNPLFHIGVFSEQMGFPEYVYDKDYVPAKPAVEEPASDAETTTVQDGQPVVGETGASDAVPSEPESGAA